MATLLNPLQLTLFMSKRRRRDRSTVAFVPMLSPVTGQPMTSPVTGAPLLKAL